MMEIRHVVTRTVSLSIALGLAFASMGAQGRGGAAIDPIRLARTSLAHGDLAGARAIAEGTAGNDPQRIVARALIDMFQGRDDDARDETRDRGRS